MKTQKTLNDVLTLMEKKSQTNDFKNLKDLWDSLIKFDKDEIQPKR